MRENPKHPAHQNNALISLRVTACKVPVFSYIRTEKYEQENTNQKKTRIYAKLNCTYLTLDRLTVMTFWFLSDL